MKKDKKFVKVISYPHSEEDYKYLNIGLIAMNSVIILLTVLSNTYKQGFILSIVFSSLFMITGQLFCRGKEVSYKEVQ